VKPGERIGPYEIVREIARGGMGVVLEVRHPNFPRPLALKLVLERPSGGASAAFMQRFEREAQILAKVDRHPNVLKVHHLGQDQGRSFLVTDYVAGKSLGSAMPLEPRRAARVARKLADALAYVHERSVLHRDLKPDNVILRDDAEDEPVLIDFGLAWVEDAIRLTRSGSTLGTPHFMSPEQATGGNGEHLDARADVYSLGATLYAALTGDAPFDADSMPALIQKLMVEPSPPPSAKRKEVPRALDAICAVALEKDAADRYQTAAEMRDDLDRFLRGEKPLALERLRAAPGARRRRLVAGAFVLVAGTILGLGSATFVRGRLAKARFAGALAAAESAARGAKTRDLVDALDAAVARLGEAAPAVGGEMAHRRLRMIAALLRTWRAVEELGDDDARVRALAAARATAREYLDLAGELGFSAASPPDELLPDVVVREANLAMALAAAPRPSGSREGDATPVVLALLARPRGAGPDLSDLRAIAFFRLGRFGDAVKAAEKACAVPVVSWTRDRATRAALEARDLPRARAFAAGSLSDARSLGVSGATDVAIALASAAEVELAAGEIDAARALLEGADAKLPEVILARAAVALARRCPGEAVAPTLETLAGATGVHAVRANELLGRARLMATFESYLPRDGPPTLDASVLAPLERAAKLGSLPTGADARPSAARALVLLAAIARFQGNGALAGERLAAALDLVPGSADAALALAGSLALPEAGTKRDAKAATRALEEAAACTADPALAKALRALAPVARGESPRVALDALDDGARSASFPADRAALALLLADLGRGTDRKPLDATRTALDLARAGSTESALLDVGLERVAFEEHAEGLVMAGLAAERRSKRGEIGNGGAGELALGCTALRAARARGDAAVAIRALDLALALRPSFAAAHLARGRAIAQATRAERGDLFEAVPDLPAQAAATRALLIAVAGDAAGADALTRGTRELGKSGLAGLALVPAPSSELGRCQLDLLTGRLLLATGAGKEAAIGPFTRARETAEAVFKATTSLEQMSEAERVVTAAYSGAVRLLEESHQELEAVALRDGAQEDLLARGDGAHDALARAETLRSAITWPETGAASAEEHAKADAARADLAAALLRAPRCLQALEAYALADMADGAEPSLRSLGRLSVALGPLRTSALTTANFLAPLTNGLLSSQGEVEVPGTASDEAAPVLARAVRRLHSIPPGASAAVLRAELARVEADLALARERAPATSAILAYRAAAAVAGGDLVSGRAFLARLRELSATTGRSSEAVAFAALIWARSGDTASARAALEELRGSGELRPEDAATFEGGAFKPCREVPELDRLLAEVVARCRSR
jgi:hypothetical protein